MEKRARAIAFYLPQFHPIPENDEWWGEGFTEWTNVKKAVPLFDGHKQPKQPGQLGYYDLRDASVREEQAILAKEYGIDGFCYWHYWFGNGKRILEHVFAEVLTSGKPDFPFCLAWANESWTGIWHGAKDKMLLEQKYPGKEDYIAHFNLLLKAFKDKRYIRVDNKPLFVVYRPHDIPNLEEFITIFRSLAIEHGLAGLYLVGNNVPDGWNSSMHGFDAVAPTGLHRVLSTAKTVVNKIAFKAEKLLNLSLDTLVNNGPTVVEYKKAISKMEFRQAQNYRLLPCVIPNWDNTPRSKERGWVLKNSTPQLWQKVLENAVQGVQSYPKEERIVFIKSWNEWAEGNYLEPDAEFGTQYLAACKKILSDK